LTALDGGEWSASRPGRFTPRVRSPGYTLDRRCGGPQSQSGHSNEKKNSQPLPGLKPLTVQPVDQHTQEFVQLIILITLKMGI